MSKGVIRGVLLAAAAVALVLAFVRLNEKSLPEGPVAIVWDGEVCGHCKMHVGDPRFAAQLQAADGAILNFDDPGCLFDYLAAHDVDAHAVYFRNQAEDGWLTESETGFVQVDDSPMGYGIAAVPKRTPGARGIDWAKSQVQSRPHHHHGGT